MAAALQGRLRLLVFDNCEHVLNGAADLVETILGLLPGIKILTTSREALGLADQQIWPVSSLDVDSAANLFIERAHTVAPNFAVEDVEAVYEICRRLDGIPLAIELAASRISSMTPGDIRDRLDQRFKLLVGSRRNMERHQTLRHAVQWSYDLLDDTEKRLLDRCSVFSGGFEIQSACAIADPTTPTNSTVVDLLQSLVRKSLLVVHRFAGHARFSMLETIRQFAEEQLAARGDAAEARDAHARHFADREAEVLSLWDSPRQREAYDWFSLELANLRSAFRWAADHDNLDVGAVIATYAAFLGFLVENYEPVGWPEELIDSARAARHPRLAFLCATATQCWFVGRVEQAISYTDAGQAAIRENPTVLPFGYEGLLSNSYMAVGQPERSVDWCRELIARTGDVHVNIRSFLVMALAIAGRGDEAIAAGEGLTRAAADTSNPHAISLALMADGFAWRNANPDRALEATLHGVAVARDSGNRFNETHLTANLAELAVERGDPLAALRAHWPGHSPSARLREHRDAAISVHESGDPA